jgi:hypothetical protein
LTLLRPEKYRTLRRWLERVERGGALGGVERPGAGAEDDLGVVGAARGGDQGVQGGRVIRAGGVEGQRRISSIRVYVAGQIVAEKMQPTTAHQVTASDPVIVNVIPAPDACPDRNIPADIT